MLGNPFHMPFYIFLALSLSPFFEAKTLFEERGNVWVEPSNSTAWMKQH